MLDYILGGGGLLFPRSPSYKYFVPSYATENDLVQFVPYKLCYFFFQLRIITLTRLKTIIT